MKKIFTLILMIFLPVFLEAQIKIINPADIGKALFANSSKRIGNVSSKLLQARYILASQSLETLQRINSQRIQALLSEENIESAIRAERLERFKEEAANSMAMFSAQVDKEYAQWADALLRERDPNFLPKKDAAIPGLLAFSPNPERVAHMTPRVFREWAFLIPTYDNLPLEVNGLIVGLRKKLSVMEMEIFKSIDQYNKAKSKLQTSDVMNTNRFYHKQMIQAERNLLRLSKESAQCVSDLVYILNLYPSVFEDSLKQLTLKLNFSLQTEFTSYLRKQIQIPTQKEKGPIGFQTRQSNSPQITGKTFSGFE